MSGARAPLEFVAWWKEHEAAVKQGFSPGVFNRLKPRGLSDDAMTAVWRCFNEMKSVLQKEGVEVKPAASTENEFAAHLADRERRIDFGAEILKVCTTRYHAAPNDREWLDSLRREMESQNPADPIAWLTVRLRDEFRFVESPPRWIAEPEWPFRDGRPLIFVTQYSIPENATTRDHLTWDETIYVFGCQTARNDGIETEYVVISQIAGLGE